MIGFIVPFQEGRPERLDAWREVRALIRRGHPTWPVITAAPYGDRWSKGEAVHRALAMLDRRIDTLIVHDADVYVPPDALAAAVRAVQDGAPWAIPHGDVYRLTRNATYAIYAGDTDQVKIGRVERPAYRGFAGGGIVVLPKVSYLEVPIDCRFHGWGCEDEAWGIALATLLGEPWRGDAALIHLWHPHPAPNQRRSVVPECVALWRRYRSARGDQERMRTIVCDASHTG